MALFDPKRLALLNRNGWHCLIRNSQNRLWEEYVYRILRKKISADWEVKGQQNQNFWETKKIRPDLVLRNKDSGQTYVIDTKWKVIDNKHPADDDLKQMYVYNHHWESAQSMLLYPKSASQKDVSGSYSLEFNGKPHHCRLGFVDVIDGNGLRKDLTEQIFRKLSLDA